MYKLAMSVLRGEHAWLEQGIASGDTEMGMEAASSNDPAVPAEFSEEIFATTH